MIRVMICLLLATTLHAEPKYSRATGSIIKTKGKIQTGNSSRIELELPYLAVVRIGSNADFSFSSNAKKLTLEKGTMLMAVPEKTEGISIESGSIVTSVVKGDFVMSNVGGQVKLITLNGKVVAALAANTSDKRSMRAGDIVTVPVGATSMPKIEAIKLSALLKTSILFNMGPLPTSRAIKQNATKQTPPGLPFFVTGGFDPDWGGSGGGSLLSSIGPAGTAAMISRMDQGKPLPPPPVIAPGQIPTQAQVVALDAAGLPVPNVSHADSRRILRGDPGIRQRLQERLRPPVAAVTPPPAPTPRPPVVIQPPIATPIPRPTQGLPVPRPTLRPPIAPP